jgi:hypothetical protein
VGKQIDINGLVLDEYFTERTSMDLYLRRSHPFDNGTLVERALRAQKQA